MKLDEVVAKYGEEIIPFLTFLYCKWKGEKRVCVSRLPKKWKSFCIRPVIQDGLIRSYKTKSGSWAVKIYAGADRDNTELSMSVKAGAKKERERLKLKKAGVDEDEKDLLDFLYSTATHSDLMEWGDEISTGMGLVAKGLAKWLGGDELALTDSGIRTLKSYKAGKI